MNQYDQNSRRVKRKDFDYNKGDLDSKKRCLELLNALHREQEVDKDYFYLCNFLIETSDPEKELICEDQIEYENNNKNEDKNEDVSVDDNNKDPEYCLFLEKLTEHGKSYKLKISQDDEEPRFLYYEEHDNSDLCDDPQTCIDDSRAEAPVSEDMQIKQKAKTISTIKEVSRRKKIKDHKTITKRSRGPDFAMDPCYHRYLTDIDIVAECNPEPKCKPEPVEYEKNVTTSDSDSDVVILDKVQNFSEVNNRQIVLADKEPSLREKLIYILKQPYNEKEYKELSEYIEQEKPVSLLKPLRNGRSRLYANAGVNKSMLDYGPDKFQRMLNDARKDPPRALNLLRMFRFWLEHVPNDEVFQPWRDKQILKLRPREKDTLTYMDQQPLLLKHE